MTADTASVAALVVAGAEVLVTVVASIPTLVGGGALTAELTPAVVAATVALVLVVGVVGVALVVVVGTSTTEAALLDTDAADGVTVVVGTLVVGTLVVGTLVVGTLVVGTLVLGALVVGTLVVGTLVVGTLVVGTLGAEVVCDGLTLGEDDAQAPDSQTEVVTAGSV